MPAIKFENVSKQYRLGEVGTGTLSHDLQRAWARMLGRPDPFSKVGQVNDRTIALDRSSTFENAEYVWALKDIDFEVQEGEIVGIIGRNGAGKSTLLKILSRVTAPTTGSIKARGRIASLLEVGTGFHPELSGRENIYLNGAILGMRRHEITRKLEGIVEFSGCAKYIDTPVKRYSSGMTVRLGFAVAAHLDCEILVVDEVLAVGDADFQSKCMGKMQDLSSSSGRTILFVSHNLAAMSNLCSTGVLLENGTVTMRNTVESTVSHYLDLGRQTAVDIQSCRHSMFQAIERLVEFEKIETKPAEKQFLYGEGIKLEITVGAKADLSSLSIGGSIFAAGTEAVLTFFTPQKFSVKADHSVALELHLSGLPIIPGKYTFGFSIGNGNENSARHDYDVVIGVPAFEILPQSSSNGSVVSNWHKAWGPICYSEHVVLNILDKPEVPLS